MAKIRVGKDSARMLIQKLLNKVNSLLDKNSEDKTLCYEMSAIRDATTAIKNIIESSNV